MQDLYEYINPRNGKHSPLISKQTYDIIMKNKDVCCMAFHYSVVDFKILCCFGIFSSSVSLVNQLNIVILKLVWMDGLNSLCAE